MSNKSTSETVERLRATLAAIDGEYGFDDDKRVDCRHFGPPDNFNKWPALTWGDLRSVLAALSAPSPASGEAMRAIIDDVEPLLSALALPSRADPAFAPFVRDLGERIGYGALMVTASALWREKLEAQGVAGGEFVVGPCQKTAENAWIKLSNALAALAPKPDEVTVPEDRESEARRLYISETDNDPTVHCNRFPAWSELSDSAKEPYRQRAKATPKPSPDRVMEGEIELDENGEAMFCTGCGTTRSVAGICAKSATALSCCPERKMLPVRKAWDAYRLATPDARLREENEVLRSLVERAQLNTPEFYVSWHEDARAALGGETGK